MVHRGRAWEKAMSKSFSLGDPFCCTASGSQWQQFDLQQFEKILRILAERSLAALRVVDVGAA